MFRLSTISLLAAVTSWSFLTACADTSHPCEGSYAGPSTPGQPDLGGPSLVDGYDLRYGEAKVDGACDGRQACFSERYSGFCRGRSEPVSGQHFRFESDDGDLVAPFAFAMDDRLFRGALDEPADRPFDIVSADMDLDRDLDVFINWHHLGRSELYENRSGRLFLLNPRGSDPTGLWEDEVVPEIFADEDEVLSEVDPSSPGLYVWHDTNRQNGRFNVYAAPSPSGTRPYRVTVWGSVEITNFSGLRGVMWERPDPYTLEFEVEDEPVHLRVTYQIIAHSLFVDAVGRHDSCTLPIFVGPEGTRVEGTLELWKPDPHGIAWVDAEGSPEPELYMSRGGVRGRLVAPNPAKVDRFYRWVGDGERLFEMDREVIPADYGRGRQVAWVDIDNVPPNELYVGNSATPNRLLRRGSEGQYHDIIKPLGLTLSEGVTVAWLDVDGDGYDDIVSQEQTGLMVGINEVGRGFRMVSGAEFGLVVPPTPEVDGFGQSTFQVIDHDSDGDLDLWFSGFRVRNVERERWGPRQLFVFERVADGFVEVSDALGLADISESGPMIPGDFDNDGFIDLVHFGSGELSLFWNRGGDAFEVLHAPCDLGIRTDTVATRSDLQNDGLADLIAAWSGFSPRFALINVPFHKNGYAYVDVPHEPLPPIGTVVRAYYSDGAVQAQRYGSASSTRWSQTVTPLHFGVPAGSSIVEIGFSFPGEATEVRMAYAEID